MIVAILLVLHSKGEVLNTFLTFVTYPKTQFSTCTKIWRYDDGGEYMSHVFQAFFVAEKQHFSTFLPLYTSIGRYD